MKRYLPNFLQQQVKVGDTLYFDLGETQHAGTIHKDETGFFINKEDEHFIKCKDYQVNQRFQKPLV